MPKENKKRGPRGRRLEEKKRKAQAAAEEDQPNVKRRKSTPDGNGGGQDFISLDIDEPRAEKEFDDPALHGTARPDEQPFYGLLDEEEQAMFKLAEETLDQNEFVDPEERTAFLEMVYQNAEGKELKMANSQSCSRLLERLIKMSTPEQLKSLFVKFSGNFIYLLQHRFASHCCEALFIQAAPVVTAEMQNPLTRTQDSATELDPAAQSMETLFMNVLNELEEYLGFFMTQKWGSHTLRVLLMVLAGEPIIRSTRKNALQSRKKEGIPVNGATKGEETLLEQREVPEMFKSALDIFISRCVEGLNTDFLRALSTHPTGNPTIQLLLQMELSHFGKQRAKDEKSIIHMLLPDDPIAEGTGSASFINGLVYDPVGSRLLETIVEHAPAKTFKSIYRDFFKERLTVLARNDVASYVVTKVLSRLGKDELAEATEKLVSQIPLLVEKNRIALIRAIIERCNVRGVPTDSIASQLEQTFSGPEGFDIAILLLLPEVSAVSEGGLSAADEERHKSAAVIQTPTQAANLKLHRSLLAQAMIADSGPLSNLVISSLTNLGIPLTLSCAKDSNASHALSAALVSPNATIIHRRKLIQQFFGHVCELALDPAGSRVIDAVWTGTHGLAFIRERVAEELAESENALRASTPGRKVWWNWKMDLYKRRRREWVLQSRQSAGREGFVGFPDELAASQEQEAKDKAVGKRGTEGKENSGVHPRDHQHHHHHHGRRGHDSAKSTPSGAAAAAAATAQNLRTQASAGRHLTAIELARQKHAMRREKKEKEQTATAKSGKDTPNQVAVN